MKKLLYVMLVVIMITALFAGCGNQQAQPSPSQGEQTETQPGDTGEQIDLSKLRLTLVTPFGAHPYWMQAEQGMLAANKDLGVNCELAGPAELNLDEQIKAIETAVASRVDGIITNGYVPEALTPAIDKAVEAGIPVVLIDADAPDSKRTCYIGTSNYDAGVEAGKAMIKSTGGKAKIGILTGPLDSANLNDRIDGFKAAIKDNPDMVILTTEVTDADLLKGTEKAQTMLQAYPDMTAIFGVSGNDIIGAGTIVEEKGLAGKLTLIGFDDLDQTLDYIRKGIVTGTTVQKPYTMGYEGVKTLVGIIQGKNPEQEVIDTGVTIVTKENVDSYK